MKNISPFVAALMNPEKIGDLTVNDFIEAIARQGKDHIAISMRTEEGEPAEWVAVVAIKQAAKDIDQVLLALEEQPHVYPAHPEEVPA
jgi:hypothetical protein